MRIYFNKPLDCWNLFCLIGKNWFLGLSLVNRDYIVKEKNNKANKKIKILRNILENLGYDYFNSNVISDLFTIFSSYDIHYDSIVFNTNAIRVYTENISFSILGDGKVGNISNDLDSQEVNYLRIYDLSKYFSKL